MLIFTWMWTHLLLITFVAQFNGMQGASSEWACGMETVSNQSYCLTSLSIRSRWQGLIISVSSPRILSNKRDIRNILTHWVPAHHNQFNSFVDHQNTTDMTDSTCDPSSEPLYTSRRTVRNQSAVSLMNIIDVRHVSICLSLSDSLDPGSSGRCSEQAWWVSHSTTRA